MIDRPTSMSHSVVLRVATSREGHNVSLTDSHLCVWWKGRGRRDGVVDRSSNRTNYYPIK